MKFHYELELLKGICELSLQAIRNLNGVFQLGMGGFWAFFTTRVEVAERSEAKSERASSEWERSEAERSEATLQHCGATVQHWSRDSHVMFLKPVFIK